MYQAILKSKEIQMHEIIYGSSFEPEKIKRRSGTTINKETADLI